MSQNSNPPAPAHGASLHPPSASPSASDKPPRHAGLIWVGLYKLGNSLFFLSIAIGAHHLLHRDLYNVVLDIASKLRFDTESHFISVVLNHTAIITEPRLRVISLFGYCYSALAMGEAIGLLLQKEWAEYLTTILTASFLPFEVYEIHLHSTPWKWLIAISNLAILIYLLWVIREIRHNKRRAA
jgi:uncharacterized membrane protein (DUF2068 family)